MLGVGGADLQCHVCLKSSVAGCAVRAPHRVWCAGSVRKAPLPTGATAIMPKTAASAAVEGGAGRTTG
ncbi:hypothetical protein Sm713_81310 [Streptomyces sp. TS71-3]|nr:hypothetical protein Sm713_81310 [Streptomyces sp. TS71-3]